MSTQNNISLEFDEFSKDYTQDMIKCVPYYLQLIDGFKSFKPAHFYPEKILDLGCGNGNVSAKLLEAFPEASYSLVDASREMLQLCKKRFEDFDFSFHQSYFSEFDFQTEYFDLIVAGFSLHHCDDHEKQSMFKDIYRSLKNGGIFSYSDLMIDKADPKHRKLLKNWKAFVCNHYPDENKWNWIMQHYDEFDKPSDFKKQLKWLQQAGFETIEIPFRQGYWTFMQALKS